MKNKVILVLIIFLFGGYVLLLKQNDSEQLTDTQIEEVANTKQDDNHLEQPTIQAPISSSPTNLENKESENTNQAEKNNDNATNDNSCKNECTIENPICLEGSCEIDSEIPIDPTCELNECTVLPPMCDETLCDTVDDTKESLLIPNNVDQCIEQFDEINLAENSLIEFESESDVMSTYRGLCNELVNFKPNTYEQFINNRPEGFPPMPAKVDELGKYLFDTYVITYETII